MPAMPHDMTGFEIQKHADGTLEFSGQFAGSDLRDLRLDHVDQQLTTAGARPDFWAADHLLILEMLFRRHAEQLQRARTGTVAAGSGD